MSRASLGFLEAKAIQPQKPMLQQVKHGLFDTLMDALPRPIFCSGAPIPASRAFPIIRRAPDRTLPTADDKLLRLRCAPQAS